MIGMNSTARVFLLLLLMGVALGGGVWVSAATSVLYPVNDFLYEKVVSPDDGEPAAWLMGLAEGCLPKGEVVIPASVNIEGVELKVVGIGRDDRWSAMADSPVFRDCPDITSVKIGENIRQIAYNEFFGCPAIEKYEVAEKNRWFSSTDGLLLETSSGYINLLRYPSARADRGWTVPAYIAKVLEGAFAANASLSTLYLSPHTEFAPCWQAGNSSILTIGASQSDIYDRSRSIDGALYLRVDNGEEPQYRLVSFCPGASWYTIQFPDNVVGIEPGAFCYANVKNVEFGPRVDIIPDRAFEYSRIETVKAPGLRNGVGKKAFANCPEFRRISIPGGEDAPEVFEIGERAFYRCEMLDTVSIGKAISRMKIGEEAFKGCESLKLFKFGSIPTKFSMVGSRAFEDCREFHSFPVQFIERFEEGAVDVFANSGLMTMIWTPSVFDVPDGCFRNCYRLKEAYMQSKARRIGADAFVGTAIREFDSQNVQTIAEGAFLNTPDLDLIYIPDASDRFVLADRFGFENPECRLIVDNKRLLAQTVEDDRSCYSNASLYISALSSFLPSDEWRQLCVPAYAAGSYRKYFPNPKEMFSIQILSPEGRIKVASEMEEVRIVKVLIGGEDAIPCEAENEWKPSIQNPEPTRMNLLISYEVCGKSMTTEYLDFLPVDMSAIVSLPETAPSLRHIGSSEYAWTGEAPWSLLSIGGTVAAKGKGDRISLEALPTGLYILHISGKGAFKILK